MCGPVCEATQQLFFKCLAYTHHSLTLLRTLRDISDVREVTLELLLCRNDRLSLEQKVLDYCCLEPCNLERTNLLSIPIFVDKQVLSQVQPIIYSKPFLIHTKGSFKRTTQVLCYQASENDCATLYFSFWKV